MQLKKGHVLQGSLLLGITAMQFHLPFYMSRTLPNTFATGLACLALGDWMSKAHPRRTIALMVFGTVRNNSPDHLRPDHLSRCAQQAPNALICLHAVLVHLQPAMSFACVRQDPASSALTAYRSGA